MSTSNFKLGAFQLSRLCQFGISRSPGHQTRPTAEHRHRKQTWHRHLRDTFTTFTFFETRFFDEQHHSGSDISKTSYLNKVRLSPSSKTITEIKRIVRKVFSTTQVSFC